MRVDPVVPVSLADDELETVVWEEVSTPAPPAGATPAPPRVHDVAAPVDLPRAVAAPVEMPRAVAAPVDRPPAPAVLAESVDADGLDLAPGPRPAWPATAEQAGAENFAPEPGIAFTPDEPVVGVWPDASAGVLSGSAADQAEPGVREPAASGRQEMPWLNTPRPSGPQETTRVWRPAGGTFDVAPPPPVPRPSGAAAVEPADGLVGPIAATVQEGHGALRGKTNPDRLRSGANPNAGSLFGSSHEEEEDLGAPARPSKTRWIAAAAVGCLALAGTLGGWALMGTSAKEPADGTPAAVSDAGRAGSDGAGTRQGQGQRAAEPSERQAPVAPATTPVSTANQPTAVPAVPTGELRVIAPFVMAVFEGGAKIGTSEALIELTAGRHRLELVNEELEFRSAETVDVRASGRVRVQPAVPRGTANINATPWAEVWVDGQASGETPLGNLSLPIGTHQIVFKHPQLGEQTRTLVVTTGAAARLSVEMKQ